MSLIIFSAKKVLFSSQSVRLSTGLLKNKSNLYLKNYGMAGHIPGTNRLHFNDQRYAQKRSTSQHRFFANKSIQKLSSETPQKLVSSLFNSSNNFNYTTMAVGLSVSKIGKGQRSEGSGRSETDSNSLKCNWMYTLAKACVLRLLIVLYCAFVLH